MGPLIRLFTPRHPFFLRQSLIFLFFFISGCVSAPSHESRVQHAEHLTSAANWQKLSLPTSDFVLMTYLPQKSHKADTLTIYLEGDGLAWVTRSTPSTDPTPKKPIGLELALQHPNDNVAYLARPCQFVTGDDKRGCSKTVWTDGRFSEQVIRASNEAIDMLKEHFGSQYLRLIGFSGGGAVAVLAASQRSDVSQLITVAGNLDHQAWTAMHRVTPLTNSLNPADVWQSVVHIPQLHFIGEKDFIVSRKVAESYQSKFPEEQKPELKIISEMSHSCCWAEQWNELSGYWLQ
ncbi:MAG: alpha/beta hydrolase [Gammaproteobacteria bacterium]|nr:MAG: alpha/beta hydrolase [Gammaproteobacteria bacterium]